MARRSDFESCYCVAVLWNLSCAITNKGKRGRPHKEKLVI